MATALSIPLTPLPSSDSSSASPPGSPMLECTSSVLRIATIQRLLLTRPLRITTCWSLATLLLLLQNDRMVREGAAVYKPLFSGGSPGTQRTCLAPTARHHF